MAQKLQVLLTCDLHEAAVAAVDTVTFAYEGQTYAFELCQEHLDGFRSSMEGWVAAARPTEGTGRPRAVPPVVGPRPATATATDSGSVREWARAEGYEVSERGRIPVDVRAAYDAAHPS